MQNLSGLSTTMTSNQPQPERPSTFFFPKAPDSSSQNTQPDKPPSSTQSQALSGPRKLRRLNLKRGLAQLSSTESQGSRIQVLNESPWVGYEKGIEIFPKNQVYLCRDRENNSELVHIQQREVERSAAQLQVDTIERLSHRSFPKLLRCYFHSDLAFFVWEPVELSLSQILGSKCSIKESQMISMVWPVISLAD